ncbi:hypothetical protein OSB04_019808, partial [Centaurea solstitialis]
MHLESIGISDTLKEINLCSSQDNAKANIFLRRHVDEVLKFEYLNTNDPSILWKDLKERCGSEDHAAYLHIFVNSIKNLSKENSRKKLGHPGSSMMRKIIGSTHGHPLKEQKNPQTGGEKKINEKDVSWCELSLSYLDPRTKQCEMEVQKMMHLQEIANQLPDAFTDTKRHQHLPLNVKIDRIGLNGKTLFRSLNVDNDPFRPCEENEDVLSPKVPYLSATRALMYLTNCTRPDISFAVNLLARFNAGYLFDPHKARSQTGYVFKNGGTAISWRSQKQTLIATSSNHVEVIALHGASRECVWLRSITQLILTLCGLEEDRVPTLIYEDNAAYVTQMKEEYIKSDRTKHIPP